MIYSPQDILVRELGGGVWFVVSGALALAFIGYVIGQRQKFGSYKWAPTCKVAIALAVFCAGSSARGLLTWLQFFYIESGYDPSPWIATWPWFGTSVVLNIVGGLACIWLLSPERWRWPVTALTFALSIALPVGLAYLI